MPSRSNMLADTFFPNALNDYVLTMTEPAPTLLKDLITETYTQTKMPQMLSGPVEGQLLRLLVSLSQAKTCLEIGTFTGYAALNIASALPVDGKLHTLELNPDFMKIAKKYFQRSPHGHKIQLHQGYAEEIIPSFQELFDFAFIDADKQNYVLYYELIMPKIKPGGLVIVDNALWGGNITQPNDPATRAIHRMNEKAKADPKVENLMLTVRDGILILRKK